MPKITVTTRSGATHTFEAESSRTLMDVIRDEGISDLLALCGGACSCATCHVHVDAEFRHLLPPITEDEDGLLDGSMHRNESSRLSCQIRISDALDGMRVTIAEED